MNNGGDAAEQVVRLSLEGMEVALKLTGAGAKNIAVLLYSILKEEQKTKGKSRLDNMLRSGKELKVFTIKNEDLKKFQSEAKRYGVLYCVLKDKDDKSANAIVDVIARSEDASKISRIVERFNFTNVEEKADIITTARESDKARKASKEKQAEPLANDTTPLKGEEKINNADELLDSIFGKETDKEVKETVNPSLKATEKSPLSEPSSKKENKFDQGIPTKPSVRDEINRIANSRKEQEKPKVVGKKRNDTKSFSKQTNHKQPNNKKRKNKSKER